MDTKNITICDDDSTRTYILQHILGKKKEFKVSLAANGATCGATATQLALSGQGVQAIPVVSGDLDFGAQACGGPAGTPPARSL